MRKIDSIARYVPGEGDPWFTLRKCAQDFLRRYHVELNQAVRLDTLGSCKCPLLVDKHGAMGNCMTRDCMSWVPARVDSTLSSTFQCTPGYCGSPMVRAQDSNI